MPSAKWSDFPTMEGPTIYRIRVRGALDSDWSERFWGMRVTGTHGKLESVLEGRLADQAALRGVLNALYELHHPVISVDCVNGDEQT